MRSQSLDSICSSCNILYLVKTFPFWFFILSLSNARQEIVPLRNPSQIIRTQPGGLFHPCSRYYYKSVKLSIQHIDSNCSLFSFLLELGKRYFKANKMHLYHGSVYVHFVIVELNIQCSPSFIVIISMAHLFFATDDSKSSANSRVIYFFQFSLVGSTNREEHINFFVLIALNAL